MSRKASQAQMLLESELLQELFIDYRKQLFIEWQSEQEMEKCANLRGRAQASHHIMQWIENKCRGLINGTD